ncbi:MAG: hypothetical protein P4L71_14765 [Acetobacteraceae bacterium]|nr:hypothetical protein [Acetobacteraceae bacterium]
MSWSGRNPGIAAAPAVPPMLDQLRRMASEAYARGAFADALDLQARATEAAAVAGSLEPNDILFLGLMLHAAKRFDEGEAILRRGIAQFPRNPAMPENLAVFLLARGDFAGAIAASDHAIALGSDSPNVHDCLCDCYNRLGRPDLAIPAGRAALAAKDRMFGGRAPLMRVPDGAPPPINLLAPAENVIAYCLWGNAPRYQVPLLENARLAPHLFPGWTLRVYHDRDVDPGYLQGLAALNVELRPMALPPNQPAHRRLLWRFDVIADPTVRRFLCRDADSLLTVKERVAIDAWLGSHQWFHAMRDWPSHTDLLLAGMWGGVGGVLPDVATLLGAYTAWRTENDHVDQDVLSEAVWPVVRQSILIHDSVFAPCLGSVPFPPFGSLPPGHHVGENAFLRFMPNT